MKPTLLLILCLFSLSLSQNAFAVLITVDATGNNAASDKRFWGFHFKRGGGSIDKISFDLRGIGEKAAFDYNRNSLINPQDGQKSTGPLAAIAFGNLKTVPQYTVDLEDQIGQGGNGRWQKLVISFKKGVCRAGCGLRFQANTSNPLSKLINGADHDGTKIEVAFHDKQKVRGELRANPSAPISQAIWPEDSTVLPAVVPLPAAAWLFLSALGMGGLVGMRRGKKAG